MQKIVLLCLAILLSGCYETQRDCTAFKTGTFEFETLVGTTLKQSTFYRNDTIEIDFYDQKIDTFSVRWVNDCEYIMKKLHPKNQAEKEPIKFTIISTTGNQYTFEYTKVIKKKNQKQIVKRGTVTKTSAKTKP